MYRFPQRKWYPSKTRTTSNRIFFPSAQLLETPPLPPFPQPHRVLLTFSDRAIILTWFFMLPQDLDLLRTGSDEHAIPSLNSRPNIISLSLYNLSLYRW